MTIFDRRRQLQQQIAQLPDDRLTQVEQYIAFLDFQKTVPSQSEVTKKGKIKRGRGLGVGN